MSEKAITETNSDTKSDENEVQETHEVESTEEVEETVESEEVEEETSEIDTESEDFKKAVTAEVERIVKARVARERDKANKLQDELDELKEHYEASQEEASEAKKEIQKLVSKNTVYEVSFETGLDAKVVESLKGDTKEDLLEAASLIKQASKPSVDGLFNGKPVREKEKGIAASILKKYNQ